MEDAQWTILPARRRDEKDRTSDDTTHSTIRIPPTLPAFQAFLRNVEALSPDRHATSLHKPFEIRALGVAPLRLDTIFVTVERGLLQKVDEIQAKFGGGFQSQTRPRPNSRSSAHEIKKEQDLRLASSPEDRLTAVTREGLSKLDVVHSGDVFALPLPTHPITHAVPPPAIVATCEPVSQGFLSPDTKIIVVQTGSSQEKALKRLQPNPPPIEEVIEDDGEDTTDQFYSAAEDRADESVSEQDESFTEDVSETEDSSRSHSDEDSDDSLDNMISLSAPGLPAPASGTMSAMTAATPRPGGRRTGTHTPGSLYSSYTSKTANTGSRPAKLFAAEVLLHRVPTETLYPRPGLDEDDDSFVFVDIAALAKIGCFSGDWVRLEAVKKPQTNPLASLDLGQLNGYPEEPPEWRPVRVFGLAALSMKVPRYAVDKTGDRRSSFSQLAPFTGLTPTALVPPLLLTSLGATQHVKISPLVFLSKERLNTHHRPTTMPAPPFAREVVLRKILTPTSTSRDLNDALFTGLQRHFGQKRRIVKSGDLLAIPVDEELSRVTFSGSQTMEDLPDDTILANSQYSRKYGVAWFSVEQVTVQPDTDPANSPDEDTWGCTGTVDVSIPTKISQSGGIIQSVPLLAQTTCLYWLGVKHAPKLSPSTFVTSAPLSGIPKPLALPLQERLSDLIMASTSPRAISLGLPPLVVLLHSSQRQVGKTHTATAACASIGLNTFAVSAHDILSEGSSSTGGGDVKTEGILAKRAELALQCGPRQTALLIQHVDVLTADRMVPALQDVISGARVVIATTTNIDKVADGIRSLFTHEIEISAPSENDRETIMKNACLEQSLRLDPLVDLGSVALKTAALVAGDLVDVVNRASLARSKRLGKLAEDQHVSVPDVMVSGGSAVTNLLPEDFNAAIGQARSTFSDSIGAPKIPTVTWNDVGGLADQKSSIMETISLPLSRPELFAKGMRKRSGILFYGPPGTGKTLLAKAIATEFSLNFFSVKGPELLNMYIGESEANVRRVFQRARDARPCVVFFDELDSVAPKRGNQGDSGGVMDRIVSQLLAELDGMSSGGGTSEDKDGTGANGNAGGVFVIGATNRPDLLDPALLRPGRFDKMLYLGVSSTHDQQVTILQALTRKFILAPDVDLKRVAEKLPLTYTGADLYALCSDAMLKAISRKTRIVDEKVKEASRIRGQEVTTAYFFDHLAKPEDIDVVVREEDFAAAQRELVASVRYTFLTSLY